ncbi:MAG: hypothetical protein NZ651_01125 [Candidatus Bipolaricaulota bacterium]|nr:hypothetical protein [Candidatus Bipolaricaulota bacterium]MDW8126370.1 hypothetical protein [Candidatus Bipolaricaulota bacterium]
MWRKTISLATPPPDVKRRIEELMRRLSEVEDALVRVEALSGIKRFRRENEIHSFLPGRVLSVDLEQKGANLRVRIILA